MQTGKADILEHCERCGVILVDDEPTICATCEIIEASPATLNRLACYLIENRIDFEYDCAWDRIIIGNCSLYVWVEADRYYAIPQMARNGASGPMTFDQVIRRIESHTS